MPSRSARAAAAAPRGAPASDGAAIAAEGLSKRFGDQVALHPLDLDVAPGTIFGFIGPSGSGKTTAVRLFTGEYAPTGGRVRVLGGDPRKLPTAVRSRIGYMPQAQVLYPYLSLLENLHFMASIYGLPLRRKARLREVLDFVELSGHERKRLQQTSGGMQRRLALAATLVHQPDLLFLDEPTTGIDPVLRRKFWDRFAELRDTGRTLFVTTQIVSEAAECDRVAVLVDGQLLAVDTPDGLRRRAYGGDLLDVTLVDPLDDDDLAALQPLVEGVEPLSADRRRVRLRVGEAEAGATLLSEVLSVRGRDVEMVERYLPPFDDVFVALVEGSRGVPTTTADHVEVPT